MGSLGSISLLAAATMFAAASPAAAQGVRAWDVLIAEASARFGVPANWIRRVMQVESAGQTVRHGRPIRSRVGAMGLMQLMPGTWQAMRRTHGLGSDPDDPHDNILAGAAYLRAMYDRFGYPGLFAAYNAGPARYAEHLARGRRLPVETVDYVARVVDPGLPMPVPPVPLSQGAAAFAPMTNSSLFLRAQPAEALSYRASVFFSLSGGPVAARSARELPDADAARESGRAADTEGDRQVYTSRWKAERNGRNMVSTFPRWSPKTSQVGTVDSKSP